MRRHDSQVALVVFLVGCGLFLISALLGHQTQAQGGSILYVAPGADCGGVERCYAHPQHAVDAASEGDVVKVASGIYTGVQGRTAPVGYEGPSVLTQIAYISKTLTLRGGYTTTN